MLAITEAQTSIPDPLVIAGRSFGSRLLMGTAGYPSQKVMLDALATAGVELVTVSIRRISLEGYAESTSFLIDQNFVLLPNTAGCSTVHDAVLTAQLARESLGTNWIKLELIGDRETLLPDMEQLHTAAVELVRDGFVVMPYCSDEPIGCVKLADAGAAVVMPLGSPIGSGLGICNPYNIELICNRSPVPVILDAGVGTASDATMAMEIGCSGVLLNTAVAKCNDPVRMARAMRLAVTAGRDAYLAGRIPRKTHAEASSPEIGLVCT
jgi:thiazole synthase